MSLVRVCVAQIERTVKRKGDVNIGSYVESTGIVLILAISDEIRFFGNNAELSNHTWCSPCTGVGRVYDYAESPKLGSFLKHAKSGFFGSLSPGPVSLDSPGGSRTSGPIDFKVKMSKNNKQDYQRCERFPRVTYYKSPPGSRAWVQCSDFGVNKQEIRNRRNLKKH
jgi:hypothetical protein